MNRFSPYWESLAGKADALPPARTSGQWLMDMLARNAHTEAGRGFGFSELTDAAAFQKAVPLCDYEKIAPQIARMAEGEEDILFAGRAVAFEYTGGSTGLNGVGGTRGAKLVPYSRESLRDFRRAMLPWLAAVIREYDLCGPAYWCVSPAMRRSVVTPGGIPVGLADGAYLGEDTAEAIMGLSAVPPWATELEEPAAWRLATLYHLIRAADLSFLFLWSPTFFISLMRGVEELGDALLALFRTGGMVEGRELRADAGAAARLTNFFACGDTRALWPGPMLISAWADGWAAGFAEELRALMPQAGFQPKGLLCTEGVVSIPCSGGRSLVAEGCGFLEFIDAEGSIHLGSGLAPGMICRVVMTTSGGLYRYCCGDMIQCTAIVEGRAAVRFVGRGGICSDMVGEKLVDGFVAARLAGIRGFSMLQPVNAGLPAYRLLLDSREYRAEQARHLARRIDEALKDNPQYAHARKSGQLGPVEGVPVREPMERYLDWVALCGASRQGVVKVPSLCVNETFQPV